MQDIRPLVNHEQVLSEVEAIIYQAELKSISICDYTNRSRERSSCTTTISSLNQQRHRFNLRPERKAWRDIQTRH